VLQLTRLGGQVLALNPDLIERAEATPDTVITLVNGSRYVVRETLEELTLLVKLYRAGIVVAAQDAMEDESDRAGARPAPAKSRERRTVVPLRTGED
jgi:flagellar protein FlbD